MQAIKQETKTEKDLMAFWKQYGPDGGYPDFEKRHAHCIPVEYHSKSVDVSGRVHILTKPGERLTETEQNGVQLGITGDIYMDLLSVDTLEDRPKELFPRAIRNKVEEAVFTY